MIFTKVRKRISQIGHNGVLVRKTVRNGAESLSVKKHVSTENSATTDVKDRPTNRNFVTKTYNVVSLKKNYY